MLSVKKKMLAFILAVFFCLTPVLALEPGELSQSGAVVAQALGQMGFTEEDDEHTPFGVRYGYPNGYWCDMFVSWCADEAGMSKMAFPRSVNCDRHSKLFSAMDRYYPSAVRGGSYVPQQGDLALFYNDAGRIHHVGLVLYVENETLFTVEGNALTTRWDYPAPEVSEARVPEEEPNDYVTVNRYPLSDKRLHGYAAPLYASREPLELEGFVDLGRYAAAEEMINAAASSGLMPGTSTHTFSPRAGMPRGEFLRTVLNLYGFGGWRQDTIPFDDVTPENTYYAAVMTARSAGLLPGTKENVFHPELWISGEDAQHILSALRRRMGLEDRIFPFTPGDLSQILTPYTTRGDIAQALYQLREEAPLTTEVFDGLLSLDGKPLDWPARTLDGVCYVPLPLLKEQFPELTVPDVLSLGNDVPAWTRLFPEAEPPAENEVPSAGAGELTFENEAPRAGDTEALDAKAILRALTLEVRGKFLQTRGFLWNGTLYIPLEETANLLHARLKAAS